MLILILSTAKKKPKRAQFFCPTILTLTGIDASIDGAPRIFNDGADVRQQLDESLMDIEQTLRNILPCV